MKKPTKKPANETDLRRWCIEQALRWPQHPYGLPNAAGMQPVYANVEIDVLGRAERIRKWVLS